jgi:hypothetical protein
MNKNNTIIYMYIDAHKGGGVIIKVRTVCTCCLHKSLTGGGFEGREVNRPSVMSPVFAGPLRELVAMSQCFIKNHINH